MCYNIRLVNFHYEYIDKYIFTMCNIPSSFEPRKIIFYTPAILLKYIYTAASISAQLHVIEAQDRHRVVSPSINVQYHKGLVSIKGPPGPGRL